METRAVKASRIESSARTEIAIIAGKSGVKRVIKGARGGQEPPISIRNAVRDPEMVKALLLSQLRGAVKQVRFDFLTVGKGVSSERHRPSIVFDLLLL